MSIKNRNYWIIMGLTLLVIIATLIIDFLLPLGVATAILYIIAVMLTFKIHDTRTTVSIAILCSLLVLTGLYISPTGGEFWKVIVNRILALVSIWVTTWLGLINDLSNRKLNISEQHTRAIVDNVVDGIITINEQGTIKTFNPAAERLFGYSTDEVLGRNVKILMPEPFRSEHDGYLEKHKRTGKAKFIGVGRELVALRKDESTFPIELTISETKKANGYIFIGIVRDISERMLFENRLRESKEVAEAANIAKSQFLANMSHELRTPLNAIIGYSEMLAEEVSEHGQTQYLDDLEKIQGSGRHLLALINDILDLSKIEAGKMELDPEIFSVKMLLDDVVATITPLAKKYDNTLTVDCDTTVTTMQTDAQKVRQVLFNLLSNAAKFTEAGEIKLIVTREETERGEELLFVVSDTGIGMDEAQLKGLFQPFMQASVDITRRFGGTGLGLAICHHFCELLGGKITVTSQPGTGSEFTLRLPSHLPKKPDDKSTVEIADKTGYLKDNLIIRKEEKQVEANKIQATVLHLNPHDEIILVIDDELEARELLRFHLSKLGYQVITAKDGMEGVALAKEHKPVAITLDVFMPHMDGWAVLKVLKSDYLLAEIPVIMCTVVDEKQTGFALGAIDYLLKPVRRDQLHNVLQKYQHQNPGYLLVVDDDAAARELLVRGVNNSGWLVSEAVNGKECLQQLAESVPDLILLDLMMPELDGFGVIEAMQQQQAWRDIPVIVITAKLLTKQERDWLNKRVAHILEKGQCSKEDLLDELSRRLDAVLTPSMREINPP